MGNTESGPKTEGRRTHLRPGNFFLWSSSAEENLPSLRPGLTFRNMPVFEGENLLASGQIPKLGDYHFSNVCDVSSQVPFISWVSILNLQPVALYAPSVALYGTLANKELYRADNTESHGRMRAGWRRALIPVGGQDIFSSPLCPSQPSVSHPEFYPTSLSHELKSVRSVNLTPLDHQLPRLLVASVVLMQCFSTGSFQLPDVKKAA